ncbi:MAG TPA: hypothetical protein VGR20_01500 [Acidimicrobiia bacterium]|nr:hypothetical protein [Acidimicrobiia bacterium]
MTGRGRLRTSALVLAALILLSALGAGLGKTPDAEQFRPRLHAVLGSGDAIGLGAGGLGAGGLGAGRALDTRLQRDAEHRPGQRTARTDGLAGPPSVSPVPGPWVSTLAATLERAGHPERLGQILLRGPPGPSA